MRQTINPLHRTHDRVANVAADITDLTTVLDSRYLKLDASNDPITGPLLIQPTVDSTTAFNVKNSIGTDVAIIDSTNGRLGINVVPLAIIHGQSTNASGLLFDCYSNTANVSSVFNFRRAKGTPSAPSAITAANDRLGFITFIGYEGTTPGFASTGSAAISVYANEAFTSTARGTHIRFETTATGSTTRSERVRIDHSGNVGIGTTSPSTKLHISGTLKLDSGVAFDMLLVPERTTNDRRLTFENSASTVNGGWQFYASNAAFSGNPVVLQVQNDGKIGMGTTTPSTARLVVQDDTTFVADFRTATSSTIGPYSMNRMSRLTNVVGRGGGFTFFMQNDASTEVEYSRFSSLIEANGAGLQSGALVFYVTKAGTVTQELMRISGANNGVGIGTATPMARLDVTGGSNTLQMLVKGNSTQTFNLVEYQISTGTVRSGIDGNGRFFSHLGTDATNFFIGPSAGNTTATALACMVIGQAAGASLTTGNYNLLIGNSAGNKLQDGNNNSFIGRNSGLNAVSSTYCTGIGTGTLQNCTVSFNTAIGALALQDTTTGQRNTAIGYGALGNNTTGNYSIAIGMSSLANNNGDSNIVFGYNAGYRQTGTSNLLLIDNQLRADIATELSNAIIVGTMASTPASQVLNINAVTNISHGLVVNEGGLSTADVRFESDTEANMLFLDANADTDGALYLGGTTNGIKINKGGELTLLGTATVWDDLRIEPVARNTGAKAPTFASWVGGLYLYEFNNALLAAEKEIFFTVQLPHGWKEGSTVEPHVHWINKTAGTSGQVVRWGLEYTKAKIGGTFSSSPTTIYATTIVGGGDITVANEHLLTDFTGIDMTGDTISTVLVCRLFRSSSDASDTYGGTAGLLYIDWHVELDSMGSKTELAK